MALASYQRTHRIASQIVQLVSALEEAHSLAKAIESEWVSNGNDSLANIDYGAALNAKITLISETFGDIDSAGVFTMGDAE